MKRLLLAGGGHAHALALLEWARQPLEGVELCLLSPEPQGAYSGMVPGWLAGCYAIDDLLMDLPALCRAAGANWLQGELTGLDPDRACVFADGHRAMSYDLLSIDVGSTLRPPADIGAPALSLRPLSRLRAEWPPLRQGLALRPEQALNVTAVGGGAAGFEALLGILAALRADAPQRPIRSRLMTRSEALLPGYPAASRRAAERALADAGVSLQLGQSADLADLAGEDLVLWATGAEAHGWQRDAARRGRLAVDEQGFIAIDAHLRSTSHPQIFASGDCAGWPGGLPKAGVYAVRQAPVLARNLRAALAGQPLRPYRPQRHFLTLLATGDGQAIASRGPLGAAGAWAWRWKDRIDRRFMHRFHSLTSKGN